MPTVRECLDYNGFDWSTGRIIYQPVGGEYPGWCSAEGAEEIGEDDERLDAEFSCGYGGPEFPRIVAEDAVAIYFPSQYDGATSLEKIWKDIGRYLDWETEGSPYPGG